jgi:hypothetical protein
MAKARCIGIWSLWVGTDSGADPHHRRVGSELFWQQNDSTRGPPAFANSLLNKIYAAIKQVNEAFSSTHKSSFKHVVLVEFSPVGQHAVGFITGTIIRNRRENGHKMVGVFVPTTPNPTAGFLVMVPESEVIPAGTVRRGWHQVCHQPWGDCAGVRAANIQTTRRLINLTPCARNPRYGKNIQHQHSTPNDLSDEGCWMLNAEGSFA